MGAEGAAEETQGDAAPKGKDPKQTEKPPGNKTNKTSGKGKREKALKRNLSEQAGERGKQQREKAESDKNQERQKLKHQEEEKTQPHTHPQDTQEKTRLTSSTSSKGAQLN